MPIHCQAIGDRAAKLATDSRSDVAVCDTKAPLGPQLSPDSGEANCQLLLEPAVDRPVVFAFDAQVVLRRDATFRVVGIFVSCAVALRKFRLSRPPAMRADICIPSRYHSDGKVRRSRGGKVSVIKIVLRDEQAKAVEEATGPVELRDVRGGLVGYVSRPVSSQDIEDAKRRLSSSGPWFTTEQVHSHLQSLEPR
jgi:hypothetical protein